MTLTFVSVHQNPPEKGFTLKRKEFAPDGSKFFSFQEDPFFRKEAKNMYLSSLIDIILPPSETGGWGVQFFLSFR